MTLIRAHKVVNGKPVGAYQIVEREDAAPEAAASDAVPAGVAGKIVRAIDRADAQGRGCAGCRAVRKTARKLITTIARPKG
jgi:hypothetical protein